MFYRFLLSVFFVSSFSVVAQTNNFGNAMNSHIFRFSDTLETVGLEDALGRHSERSEYRWLLRASYDHVNDTIVAVDSLNSNVVSKYVENIQTLSLGASYLFGKNRRVLLGFTLPVHSVVLGAGGAAATGGLTDRKTVMGDGRLHLKWRLTSDKSKWNFAIAPGVIFPTGDKKYLISDGNLSYELKLLLDRSFGAISLFSYLGYYEAQDAGFLSIDRGRRIEGGLGMFWRLSQLFGLNLEVMGDAPLGTYSKNQNSFDAILGLRLAFKRLKLFFGGSLAGLESSTSHNVGFYAGLKMPLVPIMTPIDPGPKVVLEKELPKPAPIPQRVQERVRVSNVTLFHNDSSKINERAKKSLDRAAGMIVHFQDRLGTIVIEGHTSSLGARSYNQRLSERRAKVVKDYLVSKGVYPEKLMAIGYGEDRRPIRHEKNANDRRLNRRAQFLVDEMITIREL